jgi:DNA-binding LytR/AlgR family response regulator
MFLSVTRDKEGLSGIINIHLKDVCFLESYGNLIVVNTYEEEFYLFGTLQLWFNALSGSDLPFERVDRPYVANLAKVTRVEKEWYKLYFGNKFCTVTARRFPEIMRKLEELKKG